MPVIYDRTGFPLIQIEGNGYIGIWPVTRVQYEAYIIETDLYMDSLYEATLAGNPRQSYRSFDLSNYEGIFMTNISPREVEGFCQWLGDGITLPTPGQWRRFYHVLNRTPQDLVHYPPHFQPDALQEIPRSIWERLKGIFRDPDPLQFCLMKEGLVEWVVDSHEHLNKNYKGMATPPRTRFYPMAYSPMEICQPIEKNYFVGFRVFLNQR